jgi:hypothetical protein
VLVRPPRCKARLLPVEAFTGRPDVRECSHIQTSPRLTPRARGGKPITTTENSPTIGRELAARGGIRRDVKDSRRSKVSSKLTIEPGNTRMAADLRTITVLSTVDFDSPVKSDTGLVRERLLILPIIGTIDPQRARQLTEQLLHGIRSNSSQGDRNRHNRRAVGGLDRREPPSADCGCLPLDRRYCDCYRAVCGDRADPGDDWRRSHER